MWYGEYHHSLDDKDRLILPAKFREKIKKLKIKTFYMTKGLEGCLFLFPQNVWKNLENRLKSISFTKKESRFFNRLYFSGAVELEIDSQGRIPIPTYLKEFANIEKEVTIIGIADRIEIWSKSRWKEFYEENKKRFEEVAENLFP